MDYYTLLNLTKEPFSNSPDPEMFFQSTQHQGCLQKLEMAIRLQRGLSVVIGDIGTGKSTLCRQLIQKVNTDDKTILTHLLLDPEFNSPLEFLQTISKTLKTNIPSDNNSIWQLKDVIKSYLFEQAVNNKRIPVLIIDEGQKLPDFGVEILRELLNYETNQHKLLQIIIFAQQEFQEVIKEKANFTDRITTFFKLTPMNFADTKKMIRFRLQCAAGESGKIPKLFTRPAIMAIYLLTKGYPRKIVMLCSKVIIAILVRNTRKAGVLQVVQCAHETALFKIPRVIKLSGALATVTAMLIISLLTTNQTKIITTIETNIDQSQITTSTDQTIAALQQDPHLVQSIQPAAAAPPRSNHPTEEWHIATKDQLPATLGTLPLEAGTNLSKMVARVYGRYNKYRLSKVVQASPDIKDVNKIINGTEITFPSLSSALIVPSDKIFFIQISRYEKLTGAYNMVANYPEDAEPLRIIPITKNNKIAYMVALEQSFTTPQKAQQSLTSLPKEYKKSSLVSLR